MKCGAAFFLALLLLFVTESSSYESTQDAVIADEEIRAREWIKYADTFLSDLHRIKQIGVWNFETNMTEETERQRDEGYEKFEVGLKVIMLKFLENINLLICPSFSNWPRNKNNSFTPMPTKTRTCNFN